MIKTFSILLLCAYVFGITKLGLVYSSHNFFHHISNEQHSDKDCDGSCTIIIDAEKSEKSSDTKSIKISIDNFSSHIISYFDFIPSIPKENITSNNIHTSLPEFTKLTTPPPRI